MGDRSDLIAFLVQSRREHVAVDEAEQAACVARADGYLAAGRLSDAEVLQLAALQLGPRCRTVQARYGSLWSTALADQRRRRRALGWTPPEQ